MVEMDNPIVLAMCMTMRHDFGLDKDPTSPLSSGMTEDERHFLYAEMHQVYFNNIKPILDKLEAEVDVLTDENETLKAAARSMLNELLAERSKVDGYQRNGNFNY